MTTIERDGYTLSFRNGEEFDLIYNEIFDAKPYEFVAGHAAPLILDAGAHVGLATLYFKRLYPHARIVAFEPNPVTFALLERNVRQNGLEDVELVQAALAATPGSVPFYISRETELPWSWGDAATHTAWYSEETTSVIRVPAVTLSSFLTQPVDFLKLDVEGLELIVLGEAAARLPKVKQLVIEVHGSRDDPTKSVARVLRLLRKRGFSYTVAQDGNLVDERDIRKDESYVLLVRARRRRGGILARWLGSLPRFRRSRQQ